jgi:hypothetical protein
LSSTIVPKRPDCRARRAIRDASTATATRIDSRWLEASAASDMARACAPNMPYRRKVHWILVTRTCPAPQFPVGGRTSGDERHAISDLSAFRVASIAAKAGGALRPDSSRRSVGLMTTCGTVVSGGARWTDERATDLAGSRGCGRADTCRGAEPLHRQSARESLRRPTSVSSISSRANMMRS